jgi:glycosyltransferase involved in cell wall biosynthesis
MKVAFLFSGLPHYLIALLNNLVSAYGMEVHLILPLKTGMSLGEGVRQGDEQSNYLFSVHYLEEFRGRLNKPYFRNLYGTLDGLSPEILVIGWPYILNFYFDTASRGLLKSKYISLVYREIPFMVAPRNKAISYYRKHPVINENLEVDQPRGCKFYPWAVGLNLIRKRIYRMADATMIYASHGIAIHEGFGVPGEKIFLTYNSPDTASIEKIRLKLSGEGVSAANPKRILHLGRLVKWKRVDLLIEAVAKLADRHRDIELCVIGAGPEEENLKALARKKLPKGVVRFTGSIYDPETLGREIMASGIYVLAGMGGLSINEAMAYGKPVICSRCDGTERDLVTDGINGYFFREGDADDLASKLELVLTDPGKVKALGDHSLRVIREKINLETVTRRFADCFESLKR